MATTGYHMSLLLSRLLGPGRLPSVSGTGLYVKYRPYPSLVVYAAKGTLWAVCFRDNPSKPPEVS
jgi:hypothetical protein